MTGLSVPLIEGARRPGDPAQLVADAAKAREGLGWRPQITELSEIIETAWAWHQRSEALGREPARCIWARGTGSAPCLTPLNLR